MLDEHGGGGTVVLSSHVEGEGVGAVGAALGHVVNLEGAYDLLGGAERHVGSLVGGCLDDELARRVVGLAADREGRALGCGACVGRYLLRAVRCPCQSRHRHGEGERANHGSKLLFHRFLFHLSECFNADDVLHHSTWGRGRAPPSGKQWAGAPFCGEPTATYLILITIISSLYNGFNGDCLFLTKFRNGVFCLRTYCLFSLRTPTFMRNRSLF